MTGEENPTKPIRPIRYVYEPTGLGLCSRFPCQSVSHLVMIVGDPNGKDGVITSELLRTGRKEVAHNTVFNVKLPIAMIDQLDKMPIVGYTSMTDSEICEEGTSMPVFRSYLISDRTPRSSRCLDQNTWNLQRSLPQLSAFCERSWKGHYRHNHRRTWL